MIFLFKHTLEVKLSDKLSAQVDRALAIGEAIIQPADLTGLSAAAGNLTEAADRVAGDIKDQKS